jgi:hypothetical protein
MPQYVLFYGKFILMSNTFQFMGLANSRNYEYMDMLGFAFMAKYAISLYVILLCWKDKARKREAGFWHK